MEIKIIGKICGNQDGAIFADYLFRFDELGNFCVYNISKLNLNEYNGDLKAVFKGTLDRHSEIVPHSNAVVFSNEYVNEGDEFPILYANLYNNYAGDESMTAVSLAYKIERSGNDFKTKLLGMVEISFRGEKGLWRSSEGNDVRPYGNFLIDRENSFYYAYVMIDKENVTRYFKFYAPKIMNAEAENKYNIRKVVLNKEDIRESFDTDYHNFIQGGTVHKGIIYSVEGFSHGVKEIPAIRIIDPESKRLLKYIKLPDYGYFEEPEFIDFYKGVCLYSDAEGNLYKVEL